MTLLDLITGPWAIDPERLREMQAIYAAHTRGQSVDITAVEARLGRVLANEQQAYELRENGVAVLTVSGVMAPKANMFMRVSGGISTQMLTEQVHSMRSDPRVRSALLNWDTPGGSTFGLPEASKAIRALAAEKPTVSVSTGTVASAGIWLATAANALFASGETDQLGNIGVYARMQWDPASPNAIEFTRGKFKRGGVNGQPPSAEYVAYFEGQLDYLYTLFTETVADHRGVSIDTVLERMADGRVFIGQQAVNAGLADGIATVDDLVEQLGRDPAQFAARRVARIAGASALADLVPVEQVPVPPADDPTPSTTTTPTGEAMSTTTASPTTAAAVLGPTTTREQLQAQAPALFAALQTEFTQAGAQAERDRITAVRAQSLPGHEALIERLAFDGRTTGPEAATAVLGAERALRERAVQAHAADAPPAAPPSQGDPAAAGKSREQMAAEAQAHAQKTGVDFITAFKQLGFS